MCGGDELSKNAAESLACYLLAGGIDIPEYIMQKNDAQIVAAALKNNINCVNSSSCGRLFDAVCCLLGFGNYNYYEGQCAVSLENAASIASMILTTESIVADKPDPAADAAAAAESTAE